MQKPWLPCRYWPKPLRSFFSGCSSPLSLPADDHKSSSLALDISQVGRDFYRMEEGKEDGQGLYTGEFMAQYSWAEDVAGYLDRKSGALL